MIRCNYDLRGIGLEIEDMIRSCESIRTVGLTVKEIEEGILHLREVELGEKKRIF